MENASKALLIAGGILLAVIILGMFIILSNNLNTIGQAEEEKIAAEQLAEFNAEYEAYNKRLLYGTEIITVARKAMENNRKVQNDDEHRNFVNIEITTIEDFAEVTYTVKIYSSDGRQVPSEVESENVKLAAGEYTLLDRNGDLADFFNAEFTDTREEPEEFSEGEETGYKYTYRNHALTEFKRRIFVCEKIDNNEEGRVNLLRFRQEDTSRFE